MTETTIPAAPLPGERRIDDLDDPFWAGCREGRLMLQRCGRCGRCYFPASSCVEHGPGAMGWTDASGLGTVHSFVVVHRTHDPVFQARTPYNAAIVRLDEEVLFHSSIVDCPLDEVAIGLRVRVRFDELAPGEVLPRFAPIS